MLKIFPLLFLLATSLDLCQFPTGSGRISQFVSVGQTTREYSMYVPSGMIYPAALVLAFHGIASDPDQIEAKMQMQSQADAHKFILVFPQAKNKGGNGLLDPAAFNGAACCKNDPSFQDVEFIRAIKEELVSHSCTDSDRVFIMGFSNGGFLTHRAACEDSTLFAAAAIHSSLYGDYNGNLDNSPWSSCDETTKVPMIGVMGTRDIVVPYNGGNNPNPFSRSRWFSWEETMAVWVAQNQCGSPSTVNTFDGQYFVNRTTWNQCDVENHVINGLGHDWWDQSTSYIVSFFVQHGLNTLPALNSTLRNRVPSITYTPSRISKH